MRTRTPRESTARSLASVDWRSDRPYSSVRRPRKGNLSDRNPMSRNAAQPGVATGVDGCVSRKSSIFLRRIVGVTTAAMSRHTSSVQAAGAGSHKPRAGGGGRGNDRRIPFDVHSPRSIRVTASRRCPAPNISSVTVDHDDSCELPPREGGGSPNQCFGHSRTNANPGIPARTPPLRLPRLATTAELRVIDLIAQHDPEANPELPRRRDAGFRESLLHHLPSIEAL